MQTDSFTILVGPNQCAYKIPEGRLTMHSSVFSRMFCAPFLESTQRVIKIPEENPRVFDHFYDWMHSSKPHVDLGMGSRSDFWPRHLCRKIPDLPCHRRIKFQTSSRKNGATIDWTLKFWSSVPDGAVLRQLCASNLDSMVNKNHSSIPALDFEGMYKEYEPVFLLHSDLGRDFFRATVSSNIVLKPCAYHNHRTINSPVVKDNDSICPYSAIHFGTPLDNNV